MNVALTELDLVKSAKFGALGLLLDPRYADSSLHIGAIIMNLSILCHRCECVTLNVSSRRQGDNLSDAHTG